MCIRDRAYCIGITNIDPIKYDLLFERFLNPDRKSMPDIDTDFDDEGRQKVIDYVVQKYGPVSYTHLRAHETVLDLVCRLLLDKNKTKHNTRTNKSTTQ